MKKKILQEAKKNLSTFEKISEFIFEHPELGDAEFVSSQYLAQILADSNFRVQTNYGHIPTAFRAEIGSGPLKVGFLAEYDALPGYGPNHDQAAHACGHNWIAATALGAAITLALFVDLKKTSLVVVGTPAEETIGRKCDLVKEGCFGDLSAVFQMHLASRTCLEPKIQAMDSLEFEFFGKASHAAAAPEEGINALDGVLLLFQGINARRPYLGRDSSIAGIITSGGSACNVVPDYAACRFYIRERTREKVEKLNQILIEIAQGAALMCGAKMSYRSFENSYDELKNDQGLMEKMKKNLERLGIEEFVQVDTLGGSSDIGNVSQVVPTLYVELDVQADLICFAHEEAFLEYVHGKKARGTLLTAIQAMALTAYDFIKEKESV